MCGRGWGEGEEDKCRTREVSSNIGEPGSTGRSPMVKIKKVRGCVQTWILAQMRDWRVLVGQK